jgi:protein YibB
MSNITIVTAFFDIGRGNLPESKYGRILPHYQHRSVDTYFEFFGLLAKIKNPMVIFTSGDLVDKVNSIRVANGLLDKTTVIAVDTYLPDQFIYTKERIEKVMNDPNYINKIVNPHLIEYWHSDYVLVNILKSFYVQFAIEAGFVNTDLAAWIDFGYVRSPDTLPKSLEWKYDFNPDKIHLFNMKQIDPDRPVGEIISTGDVYIQGCHIVAGVKRWIDLFNLVYMNLDILLEDGLSDDDQTFLLLSYLTKPDIFQLRFNSPDDWFRIFKDYNNA